MLACNKRRLRKRKRSKEGVRVLGRVVEREDGVNASSGNEQRLEGDVLVGLSGIDEGQGLPVGSGVGVRSEALERVHVGRDVVFLGTDLGEDGLDGGSEDTVVGRSVSS
jgi:hypothetical protein